MEWREASDILDDALAEAEANEQGDEAPPEEIELILMSLLGKFKSYGIRIRDDEVEPEL